MFTRASLQGDQFVWRKLLGKTIMLKAWIPMELGLALNEERRGNFWLNQEEDARREK